MLELCHTRCNENLFSATLQAQICTYLSVSDQAVCCKDFCHTDLTIVFHVWYCCSSVTRRLSAPFCAARCGTARSGEITHGCELNIDTLCDTAHYTTTRLGVTLRCIIHHADVCTHTVQGRAGGLALQRSQCGPTRASTTQHGVSLYYMSWH